MAVVALLCGIVITVDCGTLEPDTGWPPTENHIELFEDLGNLSFPVEASSLAQRHQTSILIDWRVLQQVRNQINVCPRRG